MRFPGLAAPLQFALCASALAPLAPPASAAEADKAIQVTLPGSGTKLKADGFVQVFGLYSHEQNLGDAGSLAGFKQALDLRATPGRQVSGSAQSSRIGLSAITPTASLGDVLARIEMDFMEGNGLAGKPHLRHAFVSFGNWIVGHTWSNWIDQDANGETVDLNGPVGGTCFGTGRLTQLRCTFDLGPGSRLAVGLEKNVTSHGVFPDKSHAAPLAPDTTVPDGRYPSLVAAYTWTGDRGHLGIRGLEQHYGAYTPGTPGSPQVRSNRWAGAMQLSGGLNLGNDKLVASCYTGQALGPYGIEWQAAEYDQTGRKVLFYRNTGWQAGYTHAWNPNVRSNLVVGAVHFNHDSTGPASIQDARSAFLNTFVKLVPSVELGMEYGYEDLQTFGNAITKRNSTMTNRNVNNKVQVSLTARF